MEKFQENSADHHSSTYVRRGVDVEGRITNDKSSITNEDCPSTLTTYSGCSVALERAVIDLHSALINSNSSALEVVCPPPGIGAKI